MGLVGEVGAYRMIEDPDLAVTVPALLVGLFFFITPLFLVVYTLVWSWPMAVRRSKGVLVGHLVFCVTTEVVALYVADAAPTMSLRAAMRMLAAFNPTFFVAFAVLWECGVRLRKRQQAQLAAEDLA